MFLNIKSEQKGKYNSRPSNKSGAGFTIIELIVVIAIIAVLAAIVITSLVTYSVRSRDTAVKANVVQLAKKAQTWFSDNGNYSGFVPDAHHPCGYIYSFNSVPDSNTSAVFARLCSNSNDYWCADSAGRNVEIYGMSGTETDCVGACQGIPARVGNRCGDLGDICNDVPGCGLAPEHCVGAAGDSYGECTGNGGCWYGGGCGTVNPCDPPLGDGNWPTGCPKTAGNCSRVSGCSER